MRVRLKGTNKVTKRLADGSTVTYHYAWKGGPRLPGKPGSAEFVVAYNTAVAAKVTPPTGVLMTFLIGYQNSTRFTDLGARTRADYIRKIKIIEREFGTLPIAALSDPRVRGEFLEWRDRLAKSSRRQADYAWTVLQAVLSWAHDRGLIGVNPCSRGGRLYDGTRVANVWTEKQEEAFLAKAPAHVRLPFLIAIWTGQREGDILALPWSAYDGAAIRLTPSKTKTRRKPRGIQLQIPIGAPLKAVLDLTAKRSPIIVLGPRGLPWAVPAFYKQFRKAKAAAGITGVTFNDLRGTAVTRLALCECTEPEICAITGHTMGEVRSILHRHYLNRDPRLAENAIRKLEAGTKIPNRAPNRPVSESVKTEKG